MALVSKDLKKAILFAALVYIIIKSFAVFSDVIIVTAVSVLLAMVLNPSVCWLEKRRIPRQLSAGLIGLSLIGLVILASFLTFPIAAKQMKQLTAQAPDIAQKANDKFYVVVEKYGLSEFISKQKIKVDAKSAGNAAGVVFAGASWLGLNTVKVTTSLFLIFIITIYLLANPKPLIRGILRIFKGMQRDNVIRAAERFDVQVMAWARGVLIGMIFIFFLTWIGLSILGIKQAFLFALIAGLLEAVPIIGPLLSAVPPIIVTLFNSPLTALYVAIVFLIIQQIEGNLLIPMIMMRQLSIHPVVIIFTVVVMGGLFGIAGVFLATPTAAAIGIVADEFWLSDHSDSEISSTTSST